MPAPEADLLPDDYGGQRTAMMPKRRRTRAQNRAQRIETERRHNLDARLARKNDWAATQLTTHGLSLCSFGTPLMSAVFDNHGRAPDGAEGLPTAGCRDETALMPLRKTRPQTHLRPGHGWREIADACRHGQSFKHLLSIRQGIASTIFTTHPGRVGGHQKGVLMWTQILRKPFWARVFIVAGCNAILGAVMKCADWLGGHHADNPYHDVYALACYVVGNLIFGLLVAAFTSNSNQAFARALWGLNPAQRSAAVDATFRGPVPDDAPVLDAAIRVAGQRLNLARFWRTIWLVFVGLPVLVAGAQLALGTYQPTNSEPSDWIFLALLLYFMVSACYVSISLKHRVEMLRQARIQSPFGATTTSAPGWYPDPQDWNLLRYFDGRMWTASTHPRDH